MRSSKTFLAFTILTLATTATAFAARVDFKDPRRALGREDNVRVDAELGQDSIAPNSSLSIVYQVENLSSAPIAIADKVSDLSYDRDSQTLLFSVGAEVPPGETLPHLTIIDPGAKHVFTAGGLVHVVMPSGHVRGMAVPRFVQIKVTVLHDIRPFAQLIAEQQKSPIAPPLPDSMFEQWVDSSSSIFLNTLPVYWSGMRTTGISAEDSQPVGQ
ncbi:MAG TPA: hypothetical protein VKH35_10445 [Thermoanaerobaculia bacterium]|jgi:hypothetical protein|nr:hypothetical protein [Thermoanaerobaculia bacterium]